MRKLLFFVLALPFMAQAQNNQDSITIKKMADANKNVDKIEQEKIGKKWVVLKSGFNSA